jgi:outer membrane lipase/esterase
VIGTYGHLNYDVKRNVPIGITSFANKAETSGTNWSLASQLGYDFAFGALRTGPVTGILWQRAEIGGFVETGGDFTSLGFERQTRDSAVSSLGWRARVDLGIWQPFVQAVWNHELADTDRVVTAYLTSFASPHFSLPAVQVGEDWGTATVGTTVDLGHGVLALGSLQSEFGDHGVKAWGGQLGINFRF